MGLDTTHNCWHGSYSAFHRWRKKLCEVAEYGDIEKKIGFGGETPWPDPKDDPLILLLDHPDCAGEIRWEDCAPIANRLEELMPSMQRAGEKTGEYYGQETQQFIKGLKLAASRKESVQFG